MDNTDKNNDIIARNLIKQGGLETPSKQFMETVMGEVNTLSVSTSVTYKPLLSKKTGLIIALMTFGVIVFILTNGQYFEELSFMPELSFFNNLSLKIDMPEFNIPKQALYSIVFFGLLFLIQFTFLKRHLENRQNFSC